MSTVLTGTAGGGASARPPGGPATGTATPSGVPATAGGMPGGAAPVSIFGIRHHGPGSARALTRALTELAPDLILVEGPPEADDLVALAASSDLEPPIALLAYPDKDAAAHTASFWPFAIFSPEWQAIRYAVDHGVPLRFCDLPVANTFGLREREMPEPPPIDALGLLARAAGYDDAERWWDDVIEHRRDGGAPFVAIGEAMAAVRAETDHPEALAGALGGEAEPESPPPGPHRDELREAYMRQVLRAAQREGYARIAVVCGAWHVPALTEPLPPAAKDAALLKGLPKVPVAMTWVPWTHGRLSYAQGYGAGVASPGWYHHLFTAPDRVVERWLVDVAALLRGEDLPVSSAHVIEATRLAETLAVLRGRPAAGLSEVVEATRAVLCDGDEVRLSLVNDRLVVGDRIGSVPSDAPSVPLVRDVAAAQKRLRMPAEALARDVRLDLRKETDLERSRLLHRLRLLGVAWGTPGAATRGSGTFWESWQLIWQPEFAVDLIAAGAYGTTVVTAATGKAAETATNAAHLSDVTELVEACLLADLPDALGPVLAALDAKVALDVDVAHLMDSLPALARSLRYGDVRGTDTGGLAGVVSGLVTRVCVALPAALGGLDDAAAADARKRIDATHAALGLLADASLREAWIDTLASVADRADLHGLLAGRICRLLRDEGRLAAAEVELRMARTLTIGVPPTQAAAWVEGFLAGGGLLLVHDAGLLALVDAWLAGIPADTFIDVLPLLRRTFSTFAAPERRTIGERARHLTGDGGAPASLAAADDTDDFAGLDMERAGRVLPTLLLLLSNAGGEGAA